MIRSNGVLTPTDTETKAEKMENGTTGKKRVAVLFGGTSNEHEVSLRSSIRIINSVDRSRYDLTLIGVDKQGRWALYDETDYLTNPNDMNLISLIPSNRYLAVLPGHIDGQLIEISNGKILPPFDVAFSVLHGGAGEDGSIQGLLRVLNIPFVGSGVLGSAVCMDKDMTKRVLRDAGLPVAPWMTLRRSAMKAPNFDEIVAVLGSPFFLKPASQGSSIGVSKVEDCEQYYEALTRAFNIDPKVLVEPAIVGREIETAVLGNDRGNHYDLETSECGEVISTEEFYSYEGKYGMNGSKTRMEIPADLKPEVRDEIKRISREAYRVTGCGVTARVDVFLTEKNEIIINEINTLPGLTPSSGYPQLWDASGLESKELMEQLLCLALETSDLVAPMKPDR